MQQQTKRNNLWWWKAKRVEGRKRKIKHKENNNDNSSSSSNSSNNNNKTTENAFVVLKKHTQKAQTCWVGKWTDTAVIPNNKLSVSVSSKHSLSYQQAWELRQEKISENLGGSGGTTPRMFLNLQSDLRNLAVPEIKIAGCWTDKNILDRISGFKIM